MPTRGRMDEDRRALERRRPRPWPREADTRRASLPPGGMAGPGRPVGSPRMASRGTCRRAIHGLHGSAPRSFALPMVRRRPPSGAPDHRARRRAGHGPRALAPIPDAAALGAGGGAGAAPSRRWRPSRSTGWPCWSAPPGRASGAHPPQALRRREADPKRPSMLDPHRAAIGGWLDAEAAITAVDVPARLKARHPERFTDTHRRIIRRMVKTWREERAERAMRCGTQALGPCPPQRPPGRSAASDGRATRRVSLPIPPTRPIRTSRSGRCSGL